MKLLKNKVSQLLRFLFGKRPKDLKNIPIFINNYNRLTTTKRLITALEERGYNNIHILDNQSTYPPLLDYYKTTTHHVHFLDKNYGSKAFWKSGLWTKYLTTYFVYTDSDVLPVKECPDNFMEYFYNLLKKYPNVHKVGFSIKIDDIPDCYINKSKVIPWESKYYTKQKEDNVYIAPIDTTFALYRPFSKRGKRDGSTEIFRVGFPYQLHHLPWYVDSKNLSEEEQYYVDSTQQMTHWTRQAK